MTLLNNYHRNMKPNNLYDTRIKILQIALDSARQKYGRNLDKFLDKNRNFGNGHDHDHNHDHINQHSQLDNIMEEYPDFTAKMIKEFYMEFEEIIFRK